MLLLPSLQTPEIVAKKKAWMFVARFEGERTRLVLIDAIESCIASDLLPLLTSESICAFIMLLLWKGPWKKIIGAAAAAAVAV